MKLNKEAEKQLRESFEMADNVRAVRDKIRKAEREGKYAIAFQMKTALDKAWEAYISKIDIKHVSIYDIIGKMNEEDELRSYINLFSISIISNILDFMIFDLKSTMGKYEKGSFTMFDELNNLGKIASTHVRFMTESSSEEYGARFAENSDYIQKIIMDEVKKGIIGEGNLKFGDQLKK